MQLFVITKPVNHSIIFRVIIPDVVSIQLSFWGWAQSCSKHVEDSNKHIIEESVRQVGHLPELYEDARSEKFKRFAFISSATYVPNISYS